MPTPANQTQITFIDDSDYHSESYTYEKEAEKYYGNSSYKFEFANDVLEYVTISYTP